MSIEERLVHIESALMELQRTVELLNESLIEQQVDVQRVQAQVKRIESLASDWGEAQRSPVDERPPHY